MSEPQSRPPAPRGRGLGRGGRGGYNSRGGRAGGRYINGDKPHFDKVDETPTLTYEDEGEIGQLKKQYAAKLSTIKEMFPDWTDEDIVFALQETDGDLESTIERISEGNISQWGEVKKKTKDRARSKVKEPATGISESSPMPSRGGRGRGSSEGSRGGRGRTTDRGRGSGRGPRGGSAMNGPRNQAPEKGISETTQEISSAPAVQEGSWDVPAATSDSIVVEGSHANPGGSTSPDASWELVTPVDPVPPLVPEHLKQSTKPDGSRSWASALFSKPVPISVQPKLLPVQSAPEREAITPPEAEGPGNDAPGLPPPVQLEESTLTSSVESSPMVSAPEPPVEIAPSKDELTEDNLEMIPDSSNPPTTATAASTVASTVDPRSGASTSTPLQQALHNNSTGPRPGLGGFATSALKATSGSGRTASFQRRILEQQEAVVMPGNHAVDRAAVQFGSMGLNGTLEDLDVDDDREDAETRTQPPQHSPVAPRAALPPAPVQPTSDPLPTPRQAPGLPPVAQHQLDQPSTQPSLPDQSLPTPSSQPTYPYHQFNNRYGPPVSQPEATAPTQKVYEPFGQQIQQPTGQQQYDGYPSQSQPPGQQQQPPSQPTQSGNYSSASNEYPSYYTSDNQRNAYQNYYGAYGQPSQQTQQETGTAQPRVGSAFGNSGAEQPTQYVTAHSQQPSQARYGSAGENQTSGNSTPNPALAPHGQTSQQSQQSQQVVQGQAGGQHGAFPYGHPFYNHPYYSAYVNQFGYGGSQGGYGSGPYGGAGGKQGMYGQPHQGYTMSSQSSYDHHSASPATVGGYGQQPHSMPGRDGAGGGGIGSYGRTGSAQPSDGQQQHSGVAGAFGGMPDVFGRSQSGFPSQSQGLAPQQSSQQTGSEETQRVYGDSAKIPGGPSPASGQPSGRPSSATNTQAQSGLPSTQGQGQQGYGSYPSQINQMQQHSQYGSGLGGLGGHHQSAAQTHQGSGYGGGYGAGFGGSYYGNNNRGGWGGNYGH